MHAMADAEADAEALALALADALADAEALAEADAEFLGSFVELIHAMCNPSSSYKLKKDHVVTLFVGIFRKGRLCRQVMVVW